MTYREWHGTQRPPRGAVRNGWRVNLPLMLLPVVVTAYAVLPGQARVVLYLGVDVTCLAGVVLAQRGRTRAQAAMWLVVALALSVSTVGDCANFLPILLHGHADSVSPVADLAFLAAYFTAGVAMAMFVRRAGATTRGDVLDACVFAVGFLALAWPLLGFADRAAEAPRLDAAAVVERLAFPMVSMLVLCVGLLAATTGAWRVPAVRSLIAAAGIGVAATVLVSAAMDAGVYTPGSIYDVGWLPMSLVVLRTALAERRHPIASAENGDALFDTALITEPSQVYERVAVLRAEGPDQDGPRFRVISSSRITALTASLAMAPLSELLFDFSRRDEVLFLGLTIVAICMVGVRLRGLMGHIRGQASELRSRALHDAVTGLPNRDHLRDAATAAVRSGARHALVFVDLDDFKTVNDTRGHAVGDLLLQAVSGRLANAARHTDLVARLGGDEFAVLMAGSSDDANTAAERYLHALSDTPVEINGERFTVKASAGVTLLEARPGTAPEQVYQDALAEADIAMYAAKRSGGGRSMGYASSLREDVLGTSELADDLSKALASGAIDVEYQPIVTTSDGTAVAMEALVRWTHPTRGRLAPGAFLPVALERGLVSDLDLLVLERAIAGAAVWRAVPGAEHVVIHVNASPAALARHDFVGHVARALALHRMPGSAVVIEITEQSLVEPDGRVDETLRGLRALDVFVALDDFGTGYSSLSYLDRFEIDTLKLDRSFLLNGAAADGHSPLLQAVLHLARTLGMAVVAEGVETTQQRDRLAGMSCPLAQGFLYSASLDLDNAIAWLASNQLRKDPSSSRRGAA